MAGNNPISPNECSLSSSSVMLSPSASSANEETDLETSFDNCCEKHCPTSSGTSSNPGPSFIAIPSGKKILDHQVGGHLYRNGKLGFLADSEEGIVLKPVQSFPRGIIECAFYSRIFSRDCTDVNLLSLRQFIPQFHGVVHMPENNVKYMKLQGILFSLITYYPLYYIPIRCYNFGERPGFYNGCENGTAHLGPSKFTGKEKTG